MVVEHLMIQLPAKAGAKGATGNARGGGVATMSTMAIMASVGGSGRKWIEFGGKEYEKKTTEVRVRLAMHTCKYSVDIR